MVELFIVKTDDNLNIADSVLNIADAEKRVSIMKIRSETERKTRLYAHVAVKIIVGKKLGLSPEKINISYLPNGKPYIENSPLKFNVSHTDKAFAISVSENETGVDIEKIRHVDMKLCDRFFTESEREYVSAGENPDDLKKRFFHVWTRKEAYLKCTGEGIIGLKSTDTETAQISSMLKTFTEGDYVISLCTKDTELHIIRNS